MEKKLSTKNGMQEENCLLVEFYIYGMYGSMHDVLMERIDRMERDVWMHVCGQETRPIFI